MRLAMVWLLGTFLAPGLLAETRPASQPGEPVIRVMSFNIRYGKAQDGENNWDKRSDLVFDVIRRHHPDLVGLQEALRFQLDEIRKALPEYDEIGVGRENGQDKGEYNTILYRKDRLRKLDGDTFWYSDTPEVPGSKSWGNTLPRLCTWARFALKDRPTVDFYHFNTHLDHISQPSREKSARALTERIQNRENNRPVILTGDFNVGEKNPVILYLTGRAPASQPAEKGPGLVDTFRAVHPDEKVAGTFNGFEGKRDGDKIDYILVTGNLQPLEAEIVRDNREGKYPSDHFPITAVLRLP